MEMRPRKGRKMFKALFNNTQLTLILVLNLLIGTCLVGAYYTAHSSDSPLTHPLVWIAGTATLAHISMIFIAIRKEIKRKSETTIWKQDIEREQEEIKKEHQKVTAELSEYKAEVLRLKDELKKKEQELSGAKNFEATLRESLKTANDELALVRQQNNRRSQAVQSMLRKISEATKLSYEAPTEHAGEDLKKIRFCVLDAALEGFDALEAFVWTDHNLHQPKYYRDFVHSALGERKLNPRAPWASEMILLAHNKSLS